MQRLSMEMQKNVPVDWHHTSLIHCICKCMFKTFTENVLNIIPSKHWKNMGHIGAFIGRTTFKDIHYKFVKLLKCCNSSILHIKWLCYI